MKVVLFGRTEVRKVVDITDLPSIPGPPKLVYLVNYLRSIYPKGRMHMVNYVNKSIPKSAVDVTSSYSNLIGTNPFWDHVFSHRGVLVMDGPEIHYYDVSKLTESRDPSYKYSKTNSNRKDYDLIEIILNPDGTYSENFLKTVAY